MSITPIGTITKTENKISSSLKFILLTSRLLANKIRLDVGVSSYLLGDPVISFIKSRFLFIKAWFLFINPRLSFIKTRFSVIKPALLFIKPRLLSIISWFWIIMSWWLLTSSTISSQFPLICTAKSPSVNLSPAKFVITTIVRIIFHISRIFIATPSIASVSARILPYHRDALTLAWWRMQYMIQSGQCVLPLSVDVRIMACPAAGEFDAGAGDIID